MCHRHIVTHAPKGACNKNGKKGALRCSDYKLPSFEKSTETDYWIWILTFLYVLQTRGFVKRLMARRAIKPVNRRFWEN